MDYDIHNYRVIKRILKNGLDKDADEKNLEELDMPQHDNIRGSDYYK